MLLNMNEILIPTAVLASLGITFGIILAIASKLFYVEVDERIPAICDILPGANCGGCGFSGCAAYADALINSGADVDACPVGGNVVQEKICEIMGVPITTNAKKTARVLCVGNFDNSSERYIYQGIDDCHAAARLGGGQKSCMFGCLGYGTCVKVCKFDAIHIENGVAVVDHKKCTACSVCVKECPKRIINIIPEHNKYTVLCKSVSSGKEVRAVCSVGCIGCRICEKACPKDAITVENNLAVINPDLCKNCGVCSKKCPQKTIWEFV